MKSPTVFTVQLIVAVYVMEAVPQTTEECHQPEPCTSAVSIAPIARHCKLRENYSTDVRALQVQMYDQLVVRLGGLSKLTAP